MRKKIDAQAQSSMTDLYSRFKELGKLVNSRIHAIGNRNAVYTTGTIFSIIDTSKNQDEHIAALGSTLNNIKYYLSGFDIDEYCFEGTIYRGYGFGHYLYLAQTLSLIHI